MHISGPQFVASIVPAVVGCSVLPGRSNFRYIRQGSAALARLQTRPLCDFELLVIPPQRQREEPSEQGNFGISLGFSRESERRMKSEAQKTVALGGAPSNM